MAYQLTSLNHMYTDAVNAIKTIKISNQRLAKDSCVQQQRIIVSQAKNKVTKWIDAIDQNYIEPQTAHRLQIMKEQLKTELAKHEKLCLLHEQNVRKQKQTLDESENNNKENLDELEFDFEHENNLIKERTKQLKNAHSQLQKINSVVLETQKLTYQQGHQLDLIDQNMSGTYVNVQESNSYLEQANKEQKKGQEKYGCLLIFCGLVLILMIGCFYFFW